MAEPQNPQGRLAWQERVNSAPSLGRATRVSTIVPVTEMRLAKLNAPYSGTSGNHSRCTIAATMPAAVPKAKAQQFIRHQYRRNKVGISMPVLALIVIYPRPD